MTILDDDDDPFVDAPDDDEYDESYGEPDTVDTGVYWRNYFTKALNVTRPADEVLGPYREENTMPMLDENNYDDRDQRNDTAPDNSGFAVVVGDDRQIKDLKRQIATAEATIKTLTGNIEQYTERIATMRATIEQIENRPEDTYPDGTYLIIESDRPNSTPTAHTFLKREDAWWFNGWKQSWRDMSYRIANSTTWRVVEMHEE